MREEHNPPEGPQGSTTLLVNMDIDNCLTQGWIEQIINEVIPAVVSSESPLIFRWKGMDGGITGRMALLGSTFLSVGGYQQKLGPAGYQDLDLMHRVLKLPGAPAKARAFRCADWSIPNGPTLEQEVFAKISQCSPEEQAKHNYRWGKMDGYNRTLSAQLIARGEIVAQPGQWIGLPFERLADGTACQRMADRIRQAAGATGSSSAAAAAPAPSAAVAGATGSSAATVAAAPSAAAAAAAAPSVAAAAAAPCGQQLPKKARPPQRPAHLAHPRLDFTFGGLKAGEAPLFPPSGLMTRPALPGRQFTLVTFGIKELLHMLVEDERPVRRELKDRLWSAEERNDVTALAETVQTALAEAGHIPHASRLILQDCRCFHDPQGRTKHNGYHPDNIHRFVHHRQFCPFAIDLLETIMTTWDESAAGLTVALFCQRGKHRSVSAAVVLQHLLESMLVGDQVLQRPTLIHTSMPIWKREGCRFCRDECQAPSDIRNQALADARATVRPVLQDMAA